jgi:hypothetical protein
VPDVFNPDQRLTIVASGLDPSSDRIVTYLAERFGVPLNAVFFRHFIDEGREYLARTWLLPPQAVEAATQRRSGASGRTYLYKGRRPRISDLLEAGLLEPGEQLVFSRPKLREAFEGTVLEDGWIQIADGSKHNAPSPAAAAAAGIPSVNGWEAWRVPRLDNVKLDDLFKALIASADNGEDRIQ